MQNAWHAFDAFNMQNTGCPQERAKQVFAFPRKLERRKKFLESIKSAAHFRQLDSLFAMTVYLPVCCSHCTGVKFTALGSCSERLVSLQFTRLRSFEWSNLERILLLLVVARHFAACDRWMQTSYRMCSQPFSDYAALQHFGRWACIPTILYDKKAE